MIRLFFIILDDASIARLTISASISQGVYMEKDRDNTYPLSVSWRTLKHLLHLLNFEWTDSEYFLITISDTTKVTKFAMSRKSKGGTKENEHLDT